jgi:hypothetical protein
MASYSAPTTFCLGDSRPSFALNSTNQQRRPGSRNSRSGSPTMPPWSFTDRTPRFLACSRADFSRDDSLTPCGGAAAGRTA